MSTVPSIATRFTQRFGVRHPFACAGMAFAGLTPDLAIAVSEAGGIGAIAGRGRSADRGAGGGRRQRGGEGRGLPYVQRLIHPRRAGELAKLSPE